jgi:hypothetical protein
MLGADFENQCLYSPQVRKKKTNKHNIRTSTSKVCSDNSNNHKNVGMGELTIHTFGMWCYESLEKFLEADNLFHKS